MTDKESNSKNQSDGSLDWALLHLLQNVKSDVVNPKIEEWRGKLTANKKADSVTVHNLKESLKYIRLNDLDNANVEKISDRNLLNEVGVKLFSSYYFIAITAHTEKDEYMFFPAVPGRLGLSTLLPDDENEFLKFLDKIQLPFRLVGDRMPEYSTNMLPGRVGLTPQVCRIALKTREIEIEKVDNFSGDLALIGREEDVVQRHASALVCPILSKDKESVLGAFVLTCQMPEAFTSKSAGNLKTVLDVWMKAPLERLHGRARQETARTVLAYNWPEFSIDGVDVGHLQNLMETELNNRAAHGMSCMSVTVGKNGEERTMVVVNVGAVVASLKAILTPGPLLARSRYTVPFPDGGKHHSANVVSHKSISKLLSVCNEVGNFRSGIAVEKTPLFSTILKNFLPLVKSSYFNSGETTRCFQVTLGEFTIIATANILDDREKVLIAHIKELLNYLQDFKISDPSFFSGQSSKIFADLETLYHTETYTDTVPEFIVSEKALSFYNDIKRVLESFGCSSIFVFEEKSCFVASSCSDWVDKEELSKVLHIPANYWVFENICKVLTTSNFDLVSFRHHDDYRILNQFKSRSRNAIDVRLSGESAIDNDIISALNFLAIPVRSWDATDKPDIDVKKSNLSKQLMEVYHKYIISLLSFPSTFPPLTRVLRSDSQSEQIDFIKKIEVVNIGEEKVDFQVFTKSNESVIFSWQRQHTKALRFVLLNNEKVAVNAVSNLPVEVSDNNCTEMKSWKISTGWKRTKACKKIETTFLDILKKQSDSRKIRKFEANQRQAHEAQWVNGIQELFDKIKKIEIDEILSPQLKEQMAEIYAETTEMSYNIGIFQLESLQEGVAAKKILSKIGTKSFRNDFLFLCQLGVKFGVKAAEDVIRGSQINHGVSIDAWDDYFLHLLEKTDSLKIDAGLAFNKVDVSYGKLEFSILLIVKVIENLIKHTIIDLYESIKPNIGTIKYLKPNHSILLSKMKLLEASFMISIGQDYLKTKNAILSPYEKDIKTSGTKRVISDLLNEACWKQGGKQRITDWGPSTDTKYFKLEIVLPDCFWRKK